MTSTINTNVVSLTAQRSLGLSQASHTTSMQRLSSGLRINSAKDDAAGLAISDRMSSQVRGLNQAARNANDGISLTQVAESALSGSASSLQRIRELAVQSINGTNNASDRQAINQESMQLIAEMDRTAMSANFNGINLLDGSTDTLQFQVGANAHETITISTANFRTNAYGLQTVTTDSVSPHSAANLAGIAASLAANDLSLPTSVRDAWRATSLAWRAVGATAETAWLTAQDAWTEVEVSTVGSRYSLLAAGDELSSFRASEAWQNVNDQSKWEALWNTPAVLWTTPNNSAPLSHQEARLKSAAAASAYRDSQSSKFDIGTTSHFDPVSSIDLTSADSATQALGIVDGALSAISSQRAKFGALQSRFETTISNVQTTSDNLSASRSRIMDADFAVETSNLSRAQILMQAGTAMVAQANQLPQSVLSLLR